MAHHTCKSLMFGAQQIPAYKTIMKKPRHLPRHSQADSRLFRVITRGAVTILTAGILAIVAANIAEYDLDARPLFTAVIPIVLVLMLWWWPIDVAPRISRWLVAVTASLFSAACLALAWFVPFREQMQCAALIVYLVAVSRVALLQLRSGLDQERTDSGE